MCLKFKIPKHHSNFLNSSNLTISPKKIIDTQHFVAQLTKNFQQNLRRRHPNWQFMMLD
jgi:ABC-type uncharacterized transport system involved in gliding motility auxiliary subunit